MFNEEEYEKIIKVISIENANKLAFRISLPLFIGLGVPYLILYWNEIIYYFTEGWSLSKYLIDCLIIVLAFFVGIVLHELIHAVSWMIAGKINRKDIKFGIMWKTLTPYCHCTQPMKIKHYIIGALMPAIIIGFIPLIIGYLLGNFMWFLVGFFFIIGAIGDFMVVNILRDEKPNDYAQDHPSEAGCFVYRKKVSKI